MKFIAFLLVAPLLAVAVMADSDTEPFSAKLQGGPTRRSTPLDFIPKLFVRQSTCPSSAPNVCDGSWCGQVCCNNGIGSYCLFGETCQDGGCCKVGKVCVGVSRGNRNSDDARAARNSASTRGTGIAAALFVGAAVAAL